MKIEKKELHTQNVYAGVMNILASVGLVLLICAFLLYAFSIVPSKIEPGEVLSSWNLSADEYAGKLGILRGWGWLEQLAYSDIIAFSSLVFLPGIVFIGFTTLIFLFIKEKNRFFAVLSGVELIVLSIAATGLLTAGH